MSRLDLVLFGASGFTGRHAVEQLASIADQRGLSWAVAGRSREKLLQILKKISDKTGKNVLSAKILIADVDHEQSVLDMCAQARVLVNCCGPYALYGEVVVRAAIHNRTHYVDVSGEPYFNEMMQLKYDKAARDAGVYVVSACGFDSIPADLGVIYLQRNFGGVLNSVESYLELDTLTASINYGSWYTFINSLGNVSKMRAVRKKIYPTPLPTFTPVLKQRSVLHKRFDSWCRSFPSNDVSSVYRTQRYFYEKDGTRPVQFKTYLKFSSLFNAVMVLLAFVSIYFLSYFKALRKFLINHFTSFSLGLVVKKPSEDIIEHLDFEITLYGEGWDERDAADIGTLPPRKSVVAKISGSNPGYGMTVVALLYSAVVILEEQHNMPPGGGVVTPGVAFAHTALLDHLQRSGLTFRLLRSKLSRPHAD